MGKRISRQAGFSILEVLIASAVALVISSAVLAAMIASQRSFVTGNAQIELQSAARMALEWLSFDIRVSRQVAASCSISGTTYTTGDDTLVLSVPAIDATNTIIDGTFDFIVYRLTAAVPAQLERIVSPAAASARPADNHIQANNVVSLTFVSGATPLSLIADVGNVEMLGITLQLQKILSSGGTVDYTARTAVRLRNRNL
ncbi:MAG: prepilin-type N-terminal cleavage/methylation domain-containing protein [Candidatus Omnitrophica bacterium]|nr:prepilin-type N-terminal cleavage/methylation domain-containing protein [Candidatus Omnitrophota bacterium]